MIPEIRSISGPPGERGIMPTEKKGKTVRRLSSVILEYLLLSAAVSLFSFLFLYTTSESISSVYLLRQDIMLTEVQESVFLLWLRSICGAAAIFIFIVLFLFMLGQRLSYLITIAKGIDRLRENKMNYNIPLEGNDELTVLAGNINYLAASQREIQRREEEMKNEREAWVRSLSHDIRTPLTSMLSLTEFMRDKEPVSHEEIRSYIELVYNKCQQIRELTSQLMDRKDCSLENVDDLGFLFAQLAQEWSGILEERFSCTVDLSKLEHFDGRVDICSLHRIMDNLISNTEKYAPPDSSVSLTIQSEGHRILLIQKNEKRETWGAPPESHKIGLDNIRQIAALYNGKAETADTDRAFEIRITLHIPPAL